MYMAFRDLIESKRYLKIRKKYLETAAAFPNKKLDARVNALLTEVHGGLPAIQKEIKEYPTPISKCDTQFDHLLEKRNKLMKAKERSPRKEKKKQKKPKR